MKLANLAMALVAACLTPHLLAQPITVAWRDKPPYHYTENGVDKGVLLERMKQVFAAAHIEARFVKEPSKRIWANFQGGVPQYCSIGWYYLEERAAWAQFSLPIHVDRPHQVLTSPEAAHQITEHLSLASLLADPQLRLGVIDGVSYGELIDTMIRRAGNQVVRRTVDTSAMVRMLHAGRFDYIFVDQDDWEYLQKREHGLGGSILVDFPDMPPGLQRHVACSKDVSPAVMARLNRAIEAAGARQAAKPR